MQNISPYEGVIFVARAVLNTNVFSTFTCSSGEKTCSWEPSAYPPAQTGEFFIKRPQKLLKVSGFDLFQQFSQVHKGFNGE